MATTADSVAALTEERAFPGKIIRECRADGCRKEREVEKEEVGWEWGSHEVIIKKKKSS